MRSLLCATLVLICFVNARALYADQAGQNDWTRQNLGRFTHAAFHGQTAYVGTAQGAIAALDLKSNEVLWRRVYASQQVLDVGLLQLNAKKQSSKKFYSVSRQKDQPGIVNVKLWDTQRRGINWEKEIVSTGEYVGSLMIDAAQFGAQSTGGVLAVAFSDSLHVLSMGKGTISFVWKGPVDVVWKDVWVYKEGSLMMAGLSQGNGLFLATISLDEKKATSVLNVESVGKVTSDPVHIVSADKDAAHSVAVLSAEKDAEIVVYDVAAMTLEKHPLKGGSKGAALISLGSTGSNKFVIAKGNDQTVYELGKSGKTLKKLGAVGDAALQLLSDPTNGETSLFVGLSRSGEGKEAAYTFIWNHPDAKATAAKVPIRVDVDRGKPVALFVQGSNKNEVSARVLVSFEDESVVAVHLKQDGAAVFWTREEALGSVIGDPIAVDVPLETIKSENDELLTLLGDEGTVPATSILIARLKSQVRSLQDTMFEFANVLQDLVSKIVQSRGRWLIQAYRGELDTSGYTEAEKSYFGFIKAIVVLTTPGKLFAIHSESGKVLWSYYDPRLRNGGATLHLTRPKLAGVLPPEVMALSTDGSTLRFDALTGKLLGSEKGSKDDQIVETMEIPLPAGSDEDHRSIAVLAMMPSKELRIFPTSVTASRAKEALAKAYIYHMDSSAQMVVGYGVDAAKMKAVELWSVAVPENHHIVSIRGHEKDAVNTPGRKIGAGSLMIKSINPHLIAVASQSLDSTGVTLSVIDSVTGRLIERLVHKNCVSPVHMVLFENSVVYTSWNEKLKRTDIFALALFESTVIEKFQLNPWNGLPDFLQATEESSFDLTAQKLVVQQKGFYLNRPIHTLGVTQTRKGITQRNVLVGTKSGQVVAVDMRFLDPRRPVGIPSKQEQEEGLISYFGEIPLIPVVTLTYHLQVELIQNIHAIPTKLESTCLVFASGLDLFYTRMQPSEGFDLIAEEFNYPLLIMMTTGLFIATTLARGAVKKKKLATQWK